MRLPKVAVVLSVEVMNVPTARQELAETHDTPRRPPNAPRLGLETNDHFFPFHDSTRVRYELELAPYEPTAVHEPAETHDTPSSSL